MIIHILFQLALPAVCFLLDKEQKALRLHEGDAGLADSHETKSNAVEGVYSIASGTTTPSSVDVDGSPSSLTDTLIIPTAANSGAILIPNIRDPEAKSAQSVCPGYVATDMLHNPLGLTATLILAGSPCNVYGNDIFSLNLTVQFQSADRLAVRVTPAVVDVSNLSHYILPDHLVHQPTADADVRNTVLNPDFDFAWSNDPTFSFSISRKTTGDVLFSTAGTKLVFEDQFIELASTLPNNYNLYGLGETIHGLRLGNNFTRTIYAADVGNPIDEYVGRDGSFATFSTRLSDFSFGRNIYGSHPFYLDTRYYEKDSNGNLTLSTSNQTNGTAEYVSYSHGVYNRNAHGHEILLRPTNITWRLLGGSIDLYFYAGPTQPEVTSAYQRSSVGLPAMQQYSTFGFHQCRWGYHNWTVLQEVVNKHETFGIPLEYIWADIDYMNQYRDFDNDPIRFSYSEGDSFLSALHASGRRFVPIIDAAIYVPDPKNASDNYSTFDNGNMTEVFIQNPDHSLYIGAVWPGYTAFPDWISEAAGDWWINEMVSWHSKLGFDGAWIDMSEASSFCVGSCGSGKISMNPVIPLILPVEEAGDLTHAYPEEFRLSDGAEARTSSAFAKHASLCPTAASVTDTDYLRTIPTQGVRDVNHPPYIINHVLGDLANHALSPNATHADGTQEYDIHNLYGHQTLNATYNALLQAIPGLRPFIIGRSTFAGSGKWAGHWGGDNTSLFAHMFLSIPQALSFSLFGIPMFGVDTCGFAGNTDEELCNRWMQLSAFFPFYRNHNAISGTPQEAYVWSSVVDATKTAMHIRYMILPYIYSLFYLSHTTGSTVMRALAWEFPNDPSLAAADRQFFLGPAILVTPVLAQGHTNVSGVFPGGGDGEVYYDWYTLAVVNATSGENITIDAPLGHIPVFVRGGNIIPTQEPAMVTRDARRNPWGVIAALSRNGTAVGELYIDDGESLVQNSTLFVEFTAADNALHASVNGTYRDTNALANVTVLGVQHCVTNVSLNGIALPGTSVFYNSTSKALLVTELNNVTSAGSWNGDWVLRWD